MMTFNQALAAMALSVVACLAYYIYNYYIYKKLLAKISLRIHVNGTRGKSSVTRLIAGGLRAHGMVVCAKTTGSAAKFIDPNGNEEFIKRLASANIKEIGSFIRRAVQDHQAQAVVVECMAVTPEYQEVLEKKFLQAHILALTNIRTDHEDIMGRGLGNIARALGKSLPVNGQLITNGNSYELLRRVGIAPTEVLISDNCDLSERELGYFPYEVIKENVQLALTVCMQVGVSRDTALRGMWSSAPDIGNVSVHYWQLADGYLQITNALAANDAESTLLLWRKYTDANSEQVLLLIHCRSDRKERTRDLLTSLIELHKGYILLSGDVEFASNILKKLGISADKIICMKYISKDLLLNMPLVKSGRINSVFAAGNIKGCGLFTNEVS